MSPATLGPVADRPLVARHVVFANREAKARYMERHAERDARDPKVLEVAARFQRLPRPERDDALLRFCQWGITYEADPAYTVGGRVRHVQLLADSAATLDRGVGKCTDKAALLVALCRACGIQAREDPVYRGAYAFPHVRTKIRGVDGRWRVADPCILNSTIGHLPAHPITNLPR